MSGSGGNTTHMSRSTKKPVRDEQDNPGVEKAGARDTPDRRPRSIREGWLIAQRRHFGSTEKILRRNAGLWRRMASKEGRRLDVEAILESSEE